MALLNRFPVNKAAQEICKKLNSNFNKPKPDLKLAVQSLEEFMTLPENSISVLNDANIFQIYEMAMDKFDFEVNDITSIIYWSTNAKHKISEIKFKNFEIMLLSNYKSITSKSLIRLLTAFATLNRFNPYLIKLIEVANKSDWTTEDFIRTALALCIFKVYSPKLWKDFKPDLTKIPITSSEEARRIKYAISTESPKLFDLKLHNQEILGDIINKLTIPTIDMNQNPLNTQSSGSNFNLSRIHQEIKYLLSGMIEFEEDYDINNAYLVDFREKNTRLLIDIDGPSHYFRSNNDVRSLSDNSLVGQILMKYRLLGKNGWNVIKLNSYEYKQFNDDYEKKFYLKRLIRNAETGIKNN